MKKRSLVIIAVLVVLTALVAAGLYFRGASSVVSGEPRPDGVPPAPSTVRIASYNIQSFGPSKMNRPATFTTLARIGSMFDAMAIQEVGSNGGSASEETAEAVMRGFVGRMNELSGGDLFGCVCAGQFAVVYRKDRFSLVGSAEYSGPEVFAYKPLIAYFKTIGAPLDFVLVTAHLRPSLAAAEIKSLSRVISEASILYAESDVICAGDFNADGSYYDEGTAAYPADFAYPAYITVVPNDADTTVAAGDFAYDRMELTSTMSSDFTGTWDVLRPASLWDLSACEGTAKTAGTERALSDHYPIWAEFHTGRDAD